MGYTKAPWTFDLDDMEIRGQYGRIVELAPRMDAIHNGRLISASPDLLAALREVLPFVEHEASLAIPKDYRARLDEIVARARGAVNKAENG